MMETKYLQRIFLPKLFIVIMAVSMSLVLPVISLAECIEGNCVNGYGHAKLRHGSYEGNFVNGEPNGEGTYYYNYKAHKYVGEFKNGMRHGKGTYYYNKAGKYVGEYKNGKRNGKGTFYWAKSGNKYVGEYKDNKRHGKGTFYWAKSGNKYVGEYKNGKRHGRGTEYFKNGDKWEGELKDNKSHGFGIYTYRSGEKKPGMWKDGEFVVRCDKSFYTYLNEGNNYLEQSRYDSAINIYEKITDEFDLDLYYMAQTNIAVALLKKGNLEESEEYFDELIKELEDTDENELEYLDKLLFHSYFNRALIKFKNDDKDGAKEDLLEAKELYPGKISRVKSMEPLYITDTNMN